MAPDIAVGFDFDHTLGIDNKLERTTALDMLAALARSEGISYDVAAAQAAIDGALVAYRDGERSLELAIAGFFERFAPSGSKTLDEAHNFRDAVLERAPQHVAPVEGALDMLAALDAMGIPYALLTNGWSPLQEEKARLIGFRGPVFVSERIGVRKPSREAFDVLAKQLETPFERLYYVGDDPSADCAGARAQGIGAIWFDWEARPYPAGIVQPDYVIHKLAELPRLMADRQSAAGNAAL